MYAIQRELHEWELRRTRVLRRFAHETANTLLYLSYLPIKFLWRFITFMLSSPKIVRQTEPGKYEEIARDYNSALIK